MAFFKSVFIKIKDGTKDNAIGNRWKDHTTMLVLSPDVPPTTGLWRTDPIDRDDIDSCGGNRGAKYVWDPKDKALYVQCPDHDSYRTALLVLNGVGEIFERTNLEKGSSRSGVNNVESPGRSSIYVTQESQEKSLLVKRTITTRDRHVCNYK
jgi:hypothetical protein